MKFDEDEFKKQMNSKVKVILLNYPHNPTSKVFSKKELKFIRQLVIDNPQVTVISGEVYINLNYKK